MPDPICSPLNNVGQRCNPVGIPNVGELPPETGCDCNCKPKKQTPQLPLNPNGCSSSGGSQTPGTCPAPSGSSGAYGAGSAAGAAAGGLVFHQWPPTIPGTAVAGPAVNPSNGNLFYPMSVVDGGAYDPPSQFTFNAQAAGQAIQYGSGVAGLFNQTLRKIGGDTVNLIKGDGSFWVYGNKDGGTGFYAAPPGAHNSLRQVGSDWVERQPNGLVLNYAELVDLVTSITYGRLATLVNRGGQVWTLSYDGTSTALTSIQDPFNRLTTYGYDGSGNLQKITDSSGRVTTFTVDGSGNLTEILTPSMCQTQHVYDTDRNLIAYVDPAG